MFKSTLYSLLLYVVLSGCTNQTGNAPDYWPQSSGPDGTWKISTSQDIPAEFSVRTGKNILWTMDLPEVGQGGITVWGDKVFLTVMEPLFETPGKEGLLTNSILALCIDASQKKILWQKPLKGVSKSPYFYGFSDSTTPAPVTDGTYVWFFNASGQLVCFDMEGNLIWERAWNPVEELDGVHFPFNKQFEPILQGDLLINMETYWEEDGQRVYGWNYLYALDKKTGEVVWISEDALTHYDTPGFNITEGGTPAMLIARGAHHQVPESPKGYSLINLKTGKSIWRYETDEGMALYNSTWTPEIALWFTEQENMVHKINAKTGELIEKLSMTADVKLSAYDTITGTYQKRESLNLSDSSVVFPAWYSNIIVGDHCYFMCFKKDNRRVYNEPEYAYGRLNLNTGLVEYLEVPVQYEIKGGDKKFIWHEDLKTETKNIRELDIAQDQRSKRDGWVWNFNPNPILINEKLFYTTMSGVVYCFDTSKEVFDERSLIGVSDLGPKGKTWTLSSPSFSEGRIYHKTSKQLICIGPSK
ncbi:MAG: PQQ-binding-like beta-propeller repeat protein [Cyclobacteriaceae bacterium]